MSLVTKMTKMQKLLDQIFNFSCQSSNTQAKNVAQSFKKTSYCTSTKMFARILQETRESKIEACSFTFF